MTQTRTPPAANVRTPDDVGRKSSAARWRWIDVALLCVALVVALLIRTRTVDPFPSFDELWHLRLSVAKGLPLGIYEPDQIYLDPPRATSLTGAPPVWRVWTDMDGVLHPPLYVLTLRLWREAFGDGNGVAHAYSIAWGVAAVAFVFAAARLAMGRTIAFLVALGVALSSTQTYFSQEIRAYAMLAGLAAIAAWWMTRIEVLGPTRRRAVVLAALTLPLMLTHYFAVGAALAIAIYGLWRFRGHRAAFTAALGAAALACAAAWGPFALQQVDDIASGDASWAVERRDVAGLLWLTLSAPFRLVADRDHVAEPMSVVAAALFVLPWLLVRRLRALAPWALLLTVGLWTLLVLDVARSTRVIMVTRYLAASSPAVFLLFAGCGAAVHRRLGVLVAGGIAVLAAVHLHAGIRVDLDVQSFGEIKNQIEARALPGESIVVHGGLQGTFFGDAVLLACVNSPTFTTRPVANITRPMTPSEMATLGERAWLIYSEQSSSPAAMLPGSAVLWQRMIDFNVYLYYVELPAGTTSAPANASSR